jgi:hypothetical protein
MRRSRTSQTGALVESHYILYIVSPHQPEFGSLDADALGEALVPLFFDEGAGDWSGVFPRIVTRFQAVGADAAAMSDFLLHHLHVSIEAQEEASALLSGRDIAPALSQVPPPPARFVTSHRDNAGESVDTEGALEERLQDQESNVRERAVSLIRSLAESNRGSGGGAVSSSDESPVSGAVSQEQQDRGKRGEEEIMRRLPSSQGWEGFVFRKDMRQQKCGYDFLCVHGGREVKLEVKTFTENGRVVVTAGELQASALGRNDYFLVGLLDEGPVTTWRTVIRQDPLPLLLTHGEFEIEASLKMPATVLWNDNDATAS